MVKFVILISQTQGRRRPCRWICRWYDREALTQNTPCDKIAKLLTRAYVTLSIRTVNYKHCNLKLEPDVKITRTRRHNLAPRLRHNVETIYSFLALRFFATTQTIPSRHRDEKAQVLLVIDPRFSNRDSLASTMSPSYSFLFFYPQDHGCAPW